MDAPSRPLSKDDIEEIRLARLFEGMVASEAWKRYADLVAKKSSEFMSNLTNAKRTRDEDMADKGALIGLEYCLRMPHAIIASASDVLARAGRVTEEDE